MAGDIKDPTLILNITMNKSTSQHLHNSTYGVNTVSMHRVVATCIVFAVVYPFILFEFTFLNICTTYVLMVGVSLMLLTGAISQDDLYEIIGQRHYHMAVLSVTGILVLFQFVEREQLLLKLFRRLLNQSITFRHYIFRVCLVTFVTSAIFTGEASSIAITPIVLKIWESHDRSRVELETLVLGISTSANIGSVSTIFGSLQMLLITAKTHLVRQDDVILDMRRCLFYLGIPSITAFLINLLFLILHQHMKMLSKSRILIRTNTWSRTNQAFFNTQSRSYQTKPPSSPPSSPRLIQGVDIYKWGNDENDRNCYRKDTDYARPYLTERFGVPRLETIPEDDILDVTLEEISINTWQYHTTQETEKEEPCLVSKYTERENYINDPTYVNHESDSVPLGNSPLYLMEYKPGKLSASNSEADSSETLMKMATYGTWTNSKKTYVSRSSTSLSPTRFLVSTSAYSVDHNHSESQPSHSGRFQILLCVVVISVFVLTLSSSSYFYFDPGKSSLCLVKLVIRHYTHHNF